MRYLSKTFFLLIATLLLSACATSPEFISEKHGFNKVMLKGGDFVITTFQRISDKNKPYIFYIEGDGNAFINKYTVSTNPTPRKQMLFRLAAMDKRPNIVYIGRPCQYTPEKLNPKCESNKYWTSKRLSDDSVEAINDVINNINNGHKFKLIGFSGGGGIAVLVAARNHMVKDIITIAGNLDHVAFTKSHNVTPMFESLNPIEFVERIKHIPQLHLSGAKDKIIKPFIAKKFVEKTPSTCAKQTIYKNISHNQGWQKIWESVYTQPIKCQN